MVLCSRFLSHDIENLVGTQSSEFLQVWTPWPCNANNRIHHLRLECLLLPCSPDRSRLVNHKSHP